MGECQRWREHFGMWLVELMGSAQVTGPGIPDPTYQPVNVPAEEAVGEFVRVTPRARNCRDAVLAEARELLARHGTGEPVKTFELRKDKWEKQKGVADGNS